MATAFNDVQAWLNGEGNLSLGNGGQDDGAGHATWPYAKKDVIQPIPLSTLNAFTQTGTLARTSAGLYTFALGAAASTGIIVVPLIPPAGFRTFIGQANLYYASGSVQTPNPLTTQPHGAALLDLEFSYTVGTAGDTAITVAFYTCTDVNATARASATYGGTTLYQNPVGTAVASLPVATQATPYVVKALPTTPAFVNTDNTLLFAEISSQNPGTSVVTITSMVAHWAVALY